jgi:hypothetical protein
MGEIRRRGRKSEPIGLCIVQQSSNRCTNFFRAHSCVLSEVKSVAFMRHFIPPDTAHRSSTPVHHWVVKLF